MTAPFLHMNKHTSELAAGMADLASKHPNDTISNALSRVSQKLESDGALFAEKLTDLDKQVIAFYQSSVKAYK